MTKFPKDPTPVGKDDPILDRPNPLDVQIGGIHYKTMKIQPVEFIMANNLGFCEGNAIKYICRHASKNGVEDLKKAIHYIEMLINDKYNGADPSEA